MNSNLVKINKYLILFIIFNVISSLPIKSVTVNELPDSLSKEMYENYNYHNRYDYNYTKCEHPVITYTAENNLFMSIYPLGKIECIFGFVKFINEAGTTYIVITFIENANGVFYICQGKLRHDGELTSAVRQVPITTEFALNKKYFTPNYRFTNIVTVLP